MEQILKLIRDKYRSLLVNSDFIFYTKKELQEYYNRLSTPLICKNKAKFLAAYGSTDNTELFDHIFEYVYDNLGVEGFDEFEALLV